MTMALEETPSESGSRLSYDQMERKVMVDPSTKIFIGNLPPECTEQEITELFEKHGRIVKITLREGYCFIQFETVEEAENALYESGRELMKRHYPNAEATEEEPPAERPARIGRWSDAPDATADAPPPSPRASPPREYSPQRGDGDGNRDNRESDNRDNGNVHPHSQSDERAAAASLTPPTAADQETHFTSNSAGGGSDRRSVASGGSGGGGGSRDGGPEKAGYQQHHAEPATNRNNNEKWRVRVTGLDPKIGWSQFKDFGRWDNRLNVINANINSNTGEGFLEYVNETEMLTAIERLDGQEVRPGDGAPVRLVEETARASAPAPLSSAAMPVSPGGHVPNGGSGGYAPNGGEAGYDRPYEHHRSLPAHQQYHPPPPRERSRSPPRSGGGQYWGPAQHGYAPPPERGGDHRRGAPPPTYAYRGRDDRGRDDRERDERYERGAPPMRPVEPYYDDRREGAPPPPYYDDRRGGGGYDHRGPPPPQQPPPPGPGYYDDRRGGYDRAPPAGGYDRRGPPPPRDDRSYRQH